MPFHFLCPGPAELNSRPRAGGEAGGDFPFVLSAEIRLGWGDAVADVVIHTLEDNEGGVVADEIVFGGEAHDFSPRWHRRIRDGRVLSAPRDGGRCCAREESRSR